MLATVVHRWPISDRNGWYRCDGWQWSKRDMYHLEKYDLELEPEFVALALRS